MSLPKITDTVSGYKYEWEAEHIQVSVSRIKANDERVAGEITITTNAPGYAPHLHQALFNFSSTRARDDLAKRLDKQFDHVEWPSILEQLSVYTLERVRRGEPAVELFAQDDIKPPNYVLHPLIIEHLPNCIFGDPGSLKSNVALLIAQLVQLPWEHNPLSLRVCPASTRCLFLDWETDKDTIQWQLTKLQRGMPDYDDNPIAMSIYYRRCAVPLINDLEAIRTLIEETQAKMVIIDSLGLACGGELVEAEPAIRFFSAIRQLNITALILAHNAKATESKSKSIYGSVYFEAGMRNVWEIKKQQEAGEDEAHLALFHKKAPPFGKLQQPIGFKLNFSETTTTVTPEDPKTVSEFMDKMGTQQRILTALKAGAMSASDLREVLPDLTENNIRVVLVTLKNKNLITTTTKGKYGLLSREEING